MLVFNGFLVVILIHQTSHKKLPRMNGEERRYLIAPGIQSNESQDSHSEKAEVRTVAFNC